MRFDDVRRGVGSFSVVNATRIEGWMLSTSVAPLDSFGLAVDGAPVGRSSTRPTPEVAPPLDVQGVVTWFAFDGPFALRHFSRVEVLACVGGQPVARMATRVRNDATQVKTEGLRGATELLDALSRHRPLDSLHRVLEWGCGSGRVTVHLIDFLEPFRAIRVDGADVDKEAIRSADANVRKGAFTTVKPYPPLPWPAGTFSAVFASSVFTHLKRELHGAWLAEMRRVLVPGGLLLASIAPTYSIAAWSNWLDVAEYIPNGLESLQDLVVLRRRFE